MIEMQPNIIKYRLKRIAELEAERAKDREAMEAVVGLSKHEYLRYENDCIQKLAKRLEE